jgi:hypothetical protein
MEQMILIAIPPCYKKMEQMMELLKTMQERMETQKGSLASKMDASHAEMKAMQQNTDDWRTNAAKNRATRRKVKPSTDVASGCTSVDYLGQKAVRKEQYNL